MPESVWQIIRDLILAPALLSCSLQALLVAGVFVQLLACGEGCGRVCRPAGSRFSALILLGGWLLSVLVVVALASLAVRHDDRALFLAAWPVTGLLWGAGLALVRGRWLFALPAGLLLGLAGWVIDAYVTPLVLFAE